ncbi:ArsA family ATPase [Paenibacillus sp. NEAU-GSW1]|uniref:ArsA family ATPase n=1 Tax=Paenibacillus sp. NEAU-GSW1 TaxID=2682486 RepID=UPI0012E0E799|nr:ArsA family ATPase [Paenibacillus sp. NEAU-GSW1]MUT67432.1 TRC40/GET3/ArsA family transport-energizing ATPase [Paenibacillus sp. NEAU-GSW1]
MRIIIYTGKGGVGKTSVAAATALRLAEQGNRTLILSTDAAHSLSDSFDLQLGSEPVQINERLWGLEVDSLQETEKHWGIVQKWLSGMISWAKLDDISTEEMLVIPGLEELFSLMEIRSHAMSGHYDAIIVDCAPTGETLRLLSYPDLLNWWLEKVFPVERRLLKIVRPVAKVVTGGLELPDDNVLNSLAAFVRELEKLQKIILDPEITSVRLVVNPEKMVIAEARRAFTYLNLSGFNTDAVIINRIFPAEAGTGYWTAWHGIHQMYEEEIRDSFSPLPILRIPMMETEVCGLTMLKRIGEAAFVHKDAAAVLYRGKVQEIRKENNKYALELVLPFVQKDQLQLNQRGDELTVKAGPYKRKVLLPKALLGRPIAGARFSDQKLIIQFGDKTTKGEDRS